MTIRGVVQCHRRAQLPAAAATAAAGAHRPAGSAAAAKIEVDVPDFLVDNNPLDSVLHSPVLAVGAAVLALLLFPKLIRLAISYLLYPAIAALLAYLAISHPEATASSIYTVLEFVKEHPAASSVGVVVAAGVLLGPDILAGSALVGVLLLLAVQAGLVQLPQPQLPKLPGQQVVAKQLGRAGAAFKQRVLELDGDDDDSYKSWQHAFCGP
ncbi:hypothetical protein OEZ86_014217 [Tetradesmus obliquus]|nr:hypothetical protein OEZ86_014217 [Tetradesmus obliquus]